MSFMKNMQEHDLSLLQILDGEYILYTSSQGKQMVIDGMLQKRASLIPGSYGEMVSTETVLHLRAVDSQDMQVGEKIAVDSQTYEIAVIRAETEGMTELVLEKLSSTF
jgi:hypothetical protein